MDLATIGGLLVGTALLSGAVVLGGSPLMFLDLPSLLIVLGGTAAATFVRFPAGQIARSLAVVRNAFGHRLPEQQEVIHQFVELSQISRREGLLALETIDVADPFMRKGIDYCVDGAELAVIEGLLAKELEASTRRHRIGIQLFSSMADAAPAFGMIGTLIGLVQMLSNMSDPRAIGPAMAVALLTTMYGAVLANLVCAPIAEKLEHRNEQEAELRTMIIEGVVALRKGDNPRMLREALDSFVAPAERVDLEEAA